MSRPELKDVVATIAEPLADIRFQKRKLGYFTRQLNEDVLGIIHLGPMRDVGRLTIDPMIGVQHRQLMLLDSDLNNRKPCSYDHMQLMRRVGAFLSRNKPYMSKPRGFWSLVDSADLRRKAPGIVGAIRNHGLPFMQRNSHLAQILETLQKFNSLGHLEPLGFYLLNQPSHALSYMAKRLKKIEGESNPGASETRALYRALIRRMEKDRVQLPPKRLSSVKLLLS